MIFFPLSRVFACSVNLSLRYMIPRLCRRVIAESRAGEREELLMFRSIVKLFDSNAALDITLVVGAC